MSKLGDVSKLGDLIQLVREEGWFCSDPRWFSGKWLFVGGTLGEDRSDDITIFTGVPFGAELNEDDDLVVRVGNRGQRITTAKFVSPAKAVEWMRSVVHTVSYHDIMTLFIASWTMSADLRDEEARYLPDEPGVLEHALKNVLDAGAFPPGWRKRLHFVDGPVGLTCVELPHILALARFSELATGIERLRVTIRHSGADRLAQRLGIPAEDVHAWGMALRKAVAEAREMLAEYPKML